MAELTAHPQSIQARLFPGLFPPARHAIEAGARRVLLSLVLLLLVGGLAFGLALPNTPELSLALAGGLAATILACLIPWHRLPENSFALFGLLAIGWMAVVIAMTRGIGSPLTPVYYLVVALSSVPLSRRLGLALGLVAAGSAALPLFYATGVRSVEVLEHLSRAVVLGIVAVFGVWLMEEARRAIRDAREGREMLADAETRSAEQHRAQQVRQEYLSVLAHELRNPLNAIGAAARVLAKDLGGHPGEATLKAIGTEAHHAMELLDGLTDVASLESGRMRLALRPIDLSSVLVEAIGAVTIGQKVHLRGAEYPTRVLGDDRRLGQVVRNLLTNAAKYSPADSEIQVSLGISANRRTAIVQVRDQGPGIPPAERHRLFEKFARLSTAGGTRGSGLGLFISRGIVNDHGGELWADWPAGGGSVFSFSVPLTGEDAPQGASRKLA